MMRRRFFLGLCAVLAVAGVSACCPDPFPPPVLYVDIDADVTGYGFTARLWEPTGNPERPRWLWQMYYDLELFELWGTGVILGAQYQGYEIRVRYGRHVSSGLQATVQRILTRAGIA